MTAKPHLKPPTATGIDTTDLYWHAVRIQNIIDGYSLDNFTVSQYEGDDMLKEIYSLSCIIMNYPHLFKVDYLEDQINRIEQCIDEKKQEERDYFKGQEI